MNIKKEQPGRASGRVFLFGCWLFLRSSEIYYSNNLFFCKGLFIPGVGVSVNFRGQSFQSYIPGQAGRFYKRILIVQPHGD